MAAGDNTDVHVTGRVARHMAARPVRTSQGGRAGAVGRKGGAGGAGAVGRAPHDGRAGRSRRVITLVVPVLLMLAGLGALLYPAAANWLSERSHAEAVKVYDEATAHESEQDRQQMLADADAYNSSLTGDPVHDPFVVGSGYSIPANYDEVLNPVGDGVMGTVQIPKIGIDLPIYHGTGEDSLERGVGHIPNTALPVGGGGRHSVLTGHRGLPSAELFTRLDELGAGDLVLVDVLGETHAYRVYATEVVLPDELASLAPQQGRDLLTLVTCTPYGVNTHRLLVHCERTRYSPEEAQSQGTGSARVSLETVARVAGSVIGVGTLVGLGIVSRRRSRMTRRPR